VAIAYDARKPTMMSGPGERSPSAQLKRLDRDAVQHFHELWREVLTWNGGPEEHRKFIPDKILSYITIAAGQLEKDSRDG